MLDNETLEKLQQRYHPHLDVNTIKVWHEAFLMFDIKKNGYISPRELKRMFLKMGQRPTNVELRDIINELDENHDGCIQFEEFLDYFHAKICHDPDGQERQNESDMKILQAAFKVFDADGSGEIDISELRQALKNIGEKISEDELRAMMAGADADGNGLIDFEEFCVFMTEQS